MECLRMCLSCKEHKDKASLKRIVKTSDGRVFVDVSGKGEGRGAYICSLECFNKCKKNRLLNRAFKCEVNSTVYDELQNQFI